jgi:hypothetical protein
LPCGLVDAGDTSRHLARTLRHPTREGTPRPLILRPVRPSMPPAIHRQQDPRWRDPETAREVKNQPA